MKIVLLGAPGAGKGSQADKIIRDYGVEHISTGDVFRENIKMGTTLGKQVSSYVENGLLVPDEVVISLMLNKLENNVYEKGFVLDGFPRTIQQAKELSKNVALDGVLNIHVDDETVVERISGRRVCSCGRTYHTSTYSSDVCESCGKKLIVRKDDTEETVLKRLKVYKQQTMPLIKYYDEKGLLFNIIGAGTVEDTYARVKKVLEGFKLK